jgi:acylphosphatase
MAPDKTVRLRITGKVQGVGYRIWATRTASGLGLRGWVRNRLDGSVEAVATGAPEQIAVLIKACRRGPYGARVAEVTAVPSEDNGSIGFTAVPTE